MNRTRDLTERLGRIVAGLPRERLPEYPAQKRRKRTKKHIEERARSCGGKP